ncbi:MAG: hypothetical protein PVF87_01200 [Acidimicrobiia bacterium]|jgi:hypothetical protein
MAFNVVALILLVLVAGPPLAARRGVHDLMAGTAVSPSRQGD